MFSRDPSDVMERGHLVRANGCLTTPGRTFRGVLLADQAPSLQCRGRSFLFRTVCIVLLTCFGASALAAEVCWPQFRGAGGNGIAETDFPTHFGPRSNVVFTAAVPPGHSSP